MSSEDTPRPFHERFDIDVGADEARQRFLNRAYNSVFDTTSSSIRTFQNNYPTDYNYTLRRYIANALGERYATSRSYEDYIRSDFRRCLLALETLYNALEDRPIQARVSASIHQIVRSSEVDLGVTWQPPMFIRTGAPLLDEGLVNEPLRWLSEPRYRTAYEPFAKGLSHYLEAERRPEVLADTVTDMYEAVEALARIVTGRDRDLSGNREAFISSIRASDYYKRLLRDYVEYANQFRHAERQDRPRPPLSESEVEAFVYLTGLFIRLAIRQD